MKDITIKNIGRSGAFIIVAGLAAWGLAYPGKAKWILLGFCMLQELALVVRSK